MARDVAPAGRPWVPSLPKPRSLARPQQPAQSEAESRLLRALEQPGCPVCSASREDHERYFFWFFAESYRQPFTRDALTRSLGFCVGHADAPARMDVGTAQLTYVYEILVRRIRELFERPPAGHGRREGGARRGRDGVAAGRARFAGSLRGRMQ
jgi:hypothetical protein